MNDWPRQLLKKSQGLSASSTANFYDDFNVLPDEVIKLWMSDYPRQLFKKLRAYRRALHQVFYMPSTDCLLKVSSPRLSTTGLQKAQGFSVNSSISLSPVDRTGFGKRAKACR